MQVVTLKLFSEENCDTMPRLDKSVNVFFNKVFRPEWRDAWVAKQSALQTRYQKTMKHIKQNCRYLPDLNEGDKVDIQIQFGSKATQWDRTGVVVECSEYGKYVVKVDESGRLSVWKRGF